MSKSFVLSLLVQFIVGINGQHLDNHLPPTIFLPVLVRNKAHSLPYFLGALESLTYPKDRIRIWFVTDHNADDSLEYLKTWTRAFEMEYSQIVLEVRDPRKGEYDDADTQLSWSRKRYEHTLKLKQEAIERARKMWADYIFYIDADNILVSKDILQRLIIRNKTIIGPMLETGLAFSNFWSEQDEETGYYERGDDYFAVRNYETKTIHKVPMLHSCYIIDLNKKESLSVQFWPRIKQYNQLLPIWPKDDVIYFSGMAKLLQIDLWVDAAVGNGWFPVPVQTGVVHNDVNSFNHMLMEMITQPPVGWDFMPAASLAALPVWPPLSKLGFTKIKMINLDRKNDRNSRMDFCLRLQGIDYERFAAVDGKKFTQANIDALGISQLPGFSDPHKPRTITRGEVGCFLSHYMIWEEMEENDIYLILEDDIRFGPHFTRQIQNILKEAETIDWDLIYVGRKRGPGAAGDVEKMVTENISTATYSYWTLGYIISGKAAKILVDEKPLSKMVPVDEYLPIMYGAHKEDKYNRYFNNRILKAFSAEPVLVQPTHYTGQVNYVTDTEPDDEKDILFKNKDEL